VLALKGNHGYLLGEVKTYLDAQSQKDAAFDCDYVETTNVGYGRIEIRRVWSSEKLDWLSEAAEWLGLRSICKVESERHLGEKVSGEAGYYLLSLPANAARGCDSLALGVGYDVSRR
jgi:hypothetical protein